MGKRKYKYGIDFTPPLRCYMPEERERILKMFDWVHKCCGGHRQAFVIDIDGVFDFKKKHLSGVMHRVRFHTPEDAMLFKLTWM